MPTVNTKTVRNLVRPRPLHASASGQETQCAVKQDKTPPHLSSQAEITTKMNTKCVRKLERPRPLHASDSGQETRCAMEQDKYQPHLSSQAEIPKKVNTKCVRKLVRPRPLHAPEPVQEMRCALEQDKSPLNLPGPAEIALKKNTKCVRKLPRPRPLHMCQCARTRDWDEDTFPPSSFRPLEDTQPNAPTTRDTPEGDVFYAFEGHGKRTIRDEFTTQELAGVDNWFTPDGCGSRHTCDTAVGGVSARFKRSVNDLAETTKVTVNKNRP